MICVIVTKSVEINSPFIDCFREIGKVIYVWNCHHQTCQLTIAVVVCLSSMSHNYEDFDTKSMYLGNG